MSDVVAIRVKRLCAEAKLPKYAHAGAWGDLAADLYAAAAVRIDTEQTLAVGTGIALEFPSEYGALVEDRSGLAVRGVTTLAGVIDPGYRGEIKVVMTNLGAAAVEIGAGDRIAQLRLVRRIEASFEEVAELVDAPRGMGGFGEHGSLSRSRSTFRTPMSPKSGRGANTFVRSGVRKCHGNVRSQR